MKPVAATDWPAAFYSLFLDSRRVFSAGDFSDPERSLDDAQLAGIDDVCRKLRLRAGDRFMDLGSGWGALVVHAAAEYGVRATGCTVGAEQFAYSQAAAASSPARDRIAFELRDCREVTGEYDKISAIGVLEHLGRRGLGPFFRQVNWLLSGDGLFLSRTIVRTHRGAKRDGLNAALLPTAAEILRQAERAGITAIAAGDFRLDYARTCRAWVSRLIENESASVRVIHTRMHRMWVDYLRATATRFEDGDLDAVETLWKRA